MPNLNVLTWNSTGETPQAAAALLAVVNYVTAQGWQPHVIVVQEANAAPGGAIYQMLAGLGGVYNQPPGHAIEGGPGGRGYLLLTHNSVQGQGTFAQADLAADATLLAWIQASLALPARQIAHNELAAMRMPACAALLFGGRIVSFLTWHTPRGPGGVLQGGIVQGGAMLDAFLFLQKSGYYVALNAPGVNNLGLIAGDLNATQAGLQQQTGYPALPLVLPGFVGITNRLDHVLGHPDPGQAGPTFSDDGAFPAPGTHDILVSTVTW
jgi:hypothetical protein